MAQHNTFTGSNSAPILIAFYEGSSGDSKGRYLKEILKWEANKLESSHDYIQTLFPLPEASRVNWNAPLIDRQVFEAFRSTPELRDRLREAFKRILWFYGFELDKDELGNPKITRGLNYKASSSRWQTRFDHNHLRITRIIRSLRVLGLEAEALAFFSALESNCARGPVSATTRMFWKRAAERPLNIRPELDEDEVAEACGSIGPSFLREFEQRRREVAEVEN